MAITKREVLYWTSCCLYGVVLTGVLLYIRFPGDKLRKYCERFIENSIPETSCTIGKIQYTFPQRIAFEKVRVTSEKEGHGVFFEDPLLSFEPLWKNPIRTFAIESTAFGGSHSATMEVDKESKKLEFTDVELKGLNLDLVPIFKNRLDRKVSGVLDLTGNVVFKTDEFNVIEADGVTSVTKGEFGLKKTILELNTLKLAESSVQFSLKKNKLVLSNGKVKNAQLSASFAGEISMRKPWQESGMKISGSVVPHAPLFKQKRQLKTIVTRMQKRYKTQSLPYHVDGTVKRPTFAFGN